MNRQQRRYLERNEEKRKTKTYNLTEYQLYEYIRKATEEEIKKNHEWLLSEAVNEAMILMLSLPLEVLMTYYWPLDYQKRMPTFIQRVLNLYEKWQNGELDIEKLKKDLWEYGGIKLEVEE